MPKKFCDPGNIKKSDARISLRRKWAFARYKQIQRRLFKPGDKLGD